MFQQVKMVSVSVLCCKVVIQWGTRITMKQEGIQHSVLLANGDK